MEQSIRCCRGEADAEKHQKQLQMMSVFLHRPLKQVQRMRIGVFAEEGNVIDLVDFLTFT